MFKALGDYFISSQGSTFPVNFYSPQQIFGDKLTIWYDFNDQSTLYSDTGFTTTISNNQNIKAIRNKGTGNGRNYNMYDDGTTVSAGTIWKQNIINSNKSISSKGGIGRLRTVSALTVSDSSSAATYSLVYRCPTTTSQIYPTTCSDTGFRQEFGITINSTTSQYTIQLKNQNANTGPLFNVITTIPAFSKTNYNIITFTVDNTGTLNLYHNDNLINTTTGVTGTTLPTFPLVSTANTSPLRINFAVGGSSSAFSTDGSEILEIILSDGICISQDQLYKLNQYFKLKYNI
jgi:hypothetical protein